MLLPHELKKVLIFQGNTLRCDCPICGGMNTFSAHKDLNFIHFRCFRASCSINGRTTNEPSVGDLEATFNRCYTTDINVRNFTIPDYISYSLPALCIDYLVANHCWEAYKAGRVDIRYDPKQDRTIFIVEENGYVTGAVGRAVDRKHLPKWLIYGHPRVLSVVYAAVASTNELSKDALLVEDAASCCSGSSIMDSYALLGSLLVPECIRALSKYDTVYIALDKDATDKALGMQKQLSALTNAIVAPLERDLKYLETEEIKQVIYG